MIGGLPLFLLLFSALLVGICLVFWSSIPFVGAMWSETGVADPGLVRYLRFIVFVLGAFPVTTFVIGHSLLLLLSGVV